MQRETTPTQAPWIVRKFSGVTYVTGDMPDRNGHFVAPVICQPILAANAPIIAASQELLEALKGVMDWWKGTPDFQDGEDEMPADIFDAAQRAIAKAEGKA